MMATTVVNLSDDFTLVLVLGKEATPFVEIREVPVFTWSIFEVDGFTWDVVLGREVTLFVQVVAEFTFYICSEEGLINMIIFL